MFADKEKIKIALFLILGALGFATGINYRITISENSFSTIKGCFEFGIYPLLEGRNNGDIFINAFFCTIKHYLLFISGMFSWLAFPLVPINLYCLCFKIGVSISYVFSVIGIKGLFSNLFLFVFYIFIMIVSVMFSYFILNRRIYRTVNKKISSDEVLFVKNSIIGLIIFFIALSLFLFVFKITGSRLYGLLNTFL